MARRKNYSDKNGVNISGVRIDGKIYHEGSCIGKLNNVRLDDFEDQVKALKKKFN